MKKENIDIIIDKQLPVKQDPYPSLESILEPYKYSSIAGKETKDKTRLFEEEKKIFQRMIDKIRDLWDSTLLTRNPNRLDSQKKIVFESYQIEWNVTVHYLDYLEKQIKETSNELQKAFQGNENGELHHQYTMIKQTVFQLYCKNEEVLVPDVIPGHLFYLLNTFCLLSSVAMNAVKIQYSLISLFENNAQEIGKYLNKEIEPVMDSLLKVKEQMENQKNAIKEIKETLAEQKKFKANTQKVLAQWIRDGIARYCRKNKRTVIEKIRDGLKFPKTPTLVSLFNDWNRYLAASSEKKEEMTEFEPYQKYTEIIYAQEKTVKEWGEQIFAPTHIKKWMAKKKEKEERRRKKRKDGKIRPDALDRIKVGGDAGEKLINELAVKEAERGGMDPGFYFDE